MNEPHKFWMVWSPQGPTPPRVRHADKATAQRAAEDMAKLHQSQEFFVMEAISVSRSVTVQTTTLTDDCPF